MTKTFLRISLVFVFLITLLGGITQAQSTGFVNSTDGDDSYTGAHATNNPAGTGPKRTLEAAYATFDDNALVYVAAGEYYKDQSLIGGGNDNDGVQFVGTKSMTFIIQTYAGSNVLYLDGTAAGAFTVNISANKTITFRPDNAGVQSVSITSGPIVLGLALTANTNAINLVAGTLDVSQLAQFEVGPSVLQMTRTNGSLTGNFAYSARVRTMLYNGTGPFVAAGELQNDLLGGTLTVALATPASTLTVPSSEPITATTGGAIENTTSGSVTFNTTVTVAGGTSAPSVIRNTNIGSMTFNSPVTISSQNEAWGTFIDNQAAGNMSFYGMLNINHAGTNHSDLDNTGGFAAAPVASNIIRNNVNGGFTIAGGITHGAATFTTAPTGTFYVYVDYLNNGTGTFNLGNGSNAVTKIYGLVQNNAGGNVNLIGDVTITKNGANLPYVALDNANASSNVLLNRFTLVLDFMGTANILNNTGAVVSTSQGVGLLDFKNALAGTVAGNGALPNIRTAVGNVTAANSTPINGNVVVDGVGNLVLTNAAKINGNVTVNAAGNFTATNATEINGFILVNDGGSVLANAATKVTGYITTAAVSTGSITLPSATTIQSDVTLGGTGNITFLAGSITTLAKNVIITGTGSFNTNPAPGAMVITQNVAITNGTFATGGGNTTVTVFGRFTENSGNLIFTGAGDVLDLKGDFYRTTGGVTPTAGTLQFSSQSTQTLSGGPNLVLWKLVTTGLNTIVNMVNGSVEIMNSALINPNSRINLGEQNIRMVGALSTITNWGKVLATPGLGCVLFEGPTQGGATANTIAGNGEYSNIEIRLANPVDFVTAGNPISFSGRLTFTRGGIDNSAQTFNPYGSAYPQIWVNLANQNADGLVDGKPFNSVIPYTLGLDPFNTTANFNNNNIAYDLTYFGANTLGVVLVGNEFKDGYVRNITTLSTGAAGKYVDITAARAFTGALYIETGAQINLNLVNLTSTGLLQSHVVNGTLTSTTAASMFVVTGSGSITGTGAGLRNIDVLDFAAANAANTLAVTGLNTLGKNTAGYGLINDLGTLTLTMPNLGVSPVVDPGNVYMINVNGGAVVLGAHAEVPTTVVGNTAVNVGAAGTFDFANYNLWYTSSNTFTSAAAATFNATGATAGNGYLIGKNSFTLNTNGALIPRVSLDAGITVTLISDTGVKEIFTNTGAGTTVTGAFTFVHAGTTWNATNNTYAGLTMKITGPVNGNFYNNVSVPVLTVDNTTANTFTLVDLWTGAGSGVPTLNVAGLFTFTTGNIAMNYCDISLNGVGGVFAYANGAFTANTTTGVSATDDQNGELVFNNAVAQSFTLGTVAPALINVRFNAGPVANLTTNPWTVSNRLVFGASDVKVTSSTSVVTGVLTLGNGAWVDRRGNGALTNNNGTPAKLKPTFAGVVDVFYSTGGAYTAAGELPTTAVDPAALRDLFVNTNVNASANITVNRSLNLMTSTWDPEPNTTVYQVAMGANSFVNVTNGLIADAPNAANTFTLTGGPVTLSYDNSNTYTITSKEFPVATTYVTKLNVLSQGNRLTFPSAGARTVGDFVMNNDVIGTQFDLNGGTLTVSNLTSSVLTKGTLISNKVDATPTPNVYVFGTLLNAGSLTSTVNTIIKNVNVTTKDAVLAGAFATEDLDGAGPVVLPGNALMHVTNDATVANFTGDLTVDHNTTVNGLFSNGTLTAKGNVTVVAPGTFGAASNLVFAGAANQNFTVPTVGVVLNQLTLDQTVTSTITLIGGNIGFTAAPASTVPYIIFKNGVLVTTGTTLVDLPTKNFGKKQGFDRTNVVVSHIFGKVRRETFNQGDQIAMSGEERTEFPLGTGVGTDGKAYYRQFALTFNPKDGKPTIPNTVFEVQYNAVTPQGQAGLPIDGGKKTNGLPTDRISVARYPQFFWYVKSKPTSVSPSLNFDLELGATGFVPDPTNPNDVRIIRRHGSVGDIDNNWLLQGAEGVVNVPIENQYDNQYDRSVTPATFAVIDRQSLAGLRFDGAIFTLGLTTNLATDVVPTTASAKVATVGGVIDHNFDQKYIANLNATGAKWFKNNRGTLTYTVVTSNNNASATVAAGILTVSPIAVGSSQVTVTAWDLDNNDFMSYTFTVNIGVVGTNKEESALPTSFAMSQNYPNPFNPTTTIKYDLPKEAMVTIKVINMLGQEVASLVNDVKAAGFHSVNFNANGLASGRYLAVIKAGDFTKTIKMNLLK